MFKIIKVTALGFLIFTTSALCQSDDLKSLVHSKVEYFNYRKVPGWEFDELKKLLRAYNKSDVANAFIADLDTDRGSPDANSFRDHIVQRLYTGLDLPAHNICQQLEKEKSEKRKIQLMQILPESTDPEIILTLLHQISDQREGIDFTGDTEGAPKPPGFRVCDVAFNMLAGYLTKKRGSIGFEDSIQSRDAIIRDGLKQLRSEGLLKL